MSVLTLVRHGQASYMAEDYDRLSALGEEQARKLGEFWVRHGIHFDLCYHGPAKRHRKTAEIALPAGTEMRVVAEIDEFDAFRVMQLMVPRLVESDPAIRAMHDDFRANQQSPEGGRKLQKLFEAVSRCWCSGEYDMPEVESWTQFKARVRAGVEQIRLEAGSGKNVVAITSGGPISATVADVMNLPPLVAIELLWLSRNCSFSEFLFSGDRYSMHSFNSIPHLDDRRLVTYR
ncbi:MAG TPA: histidine phosphatase family protein [Bryobacteraceae bacterium]|nr:histidine phosphatase family protein [Bryobacteraceae bacterium]